MTVGDRIRYFRERAGMTQQELADKVGLRFPAISKYELGTVDNIPLKNIEALASALGVTGGQLLGWDDDWIVTDEESKMRAELHRRIDEAPASVLKIAISLLSLPAEQLEALGTLTAHIRDDSAL